MATVDPGVKSDFQLEWERREAEMPRAVRLRELGLSYEAISKVMGEYHGLYFAAMTWRHHLVGRFGVAKNPNKPSPRQLRDRFLHESRDRA